MAMNMAIKTDEIADLAALYNLDFVVLFGSQATGRVHKKSDIDIGVISRAKVDLHKIGARLEEIFASEDVEVVNLAQISPTLMFAVVRDGKLLFEKNPGTYLRWKVYAAKIWMDTAWLRTFRDRKLVEWANKVK